MIGKLFLIIIGSMCCHINGNLFSKEIPSGRIIGGVERDISEIPFQISFWNGTQHFCGGALMSSKWVITAAHCLGKYKNPSVRINSSDCTTGGLLVKVINEFTHPEFDEYSYDYDVAVVELDQFNANGLKFVRFPKSGLNLCKPGDMVEVSGWGVNNIEDEKKKNMLQSVRLEIVEEKKCYDYFKHNFDVTARMMCAGVEAGGKDACQGDSGGPATCKGDLIAVVSSGFDCAKANTPGLYTNIFDDDIKHWIHEVTGIETKFVAKTPVLATTTTTTTTKAPISKPKPKPKPKPTKKPVKPLKPNKIKHKPIKRSDWNLLMNQLKKG